MNFDIAAREAFFDLTYKMIENGFPVIMPDPEGKPLAGEIYSVDDETLARLDQLEREGSSYDRKLIDVTLPLAARSMRPLLVQEGRQAKVTFLARTRDQLLTTEHSEGVLIRIKHRASRVWNDGALHGVRRPQHPRECDASGAVDGERIHRAFEGRAQPTGKGIDEKKAVATENQSIEWLVDPEDIAALAVLGVGRRHVNLTANAADRCGHAERRGLRYGQAKGQRRHHPGGMASRKSHSARSRRGR